MDGFERLASDVVAIDAERYLPTVPGFTVAARSKDGSWQYSKAFGKGEVRADAPDLTVGSTFWIASMTKIVTSIAAMQCVEKGLLSLDEDITKVLPEWKDPRYHDGFDKETGEPILKPTDAKITLRTLLTHMTGMSTKGYHPLKQYYQSLDSPPLEWREPFEEQDRYSFTLVQHPNTVFHYGASIDWAGRMVERVTGLKLEEYFRKYIFAPLGVENLTFHLEKQAHVRSHLTPLTHRGEHGSFTISTLDQFITDPISEARGGGGLYSDAQSFVKVLASMLDETLLKKETISEMFSPQLEDSDLFHSTCVETASSEIFTVAALGSIPLETRINFGIGGVVTLEDIVGARRSGSLSWSGLPNCYWWVDRETGVCGCYCSHLIPPDRHALSSDLRVWPSVSMICEFNDMMMKYYLLGSTPRPPSMHTLSR
ncbi:beta-lactamase/transpeptidase-like protein [Delphinella strobiligena]|nr:beta-lactamase/transpeptidase-like protein [Delphinella strobiligena]